MNNLRNFFYAIIFLFFTYNLALHANETLKPIKTNKPPVIDGILDDDVWKEAPFVTNFKTFIPDFGKEASQKTEAYMAYDRENLYFAYKCYDTEPEKIKGSVTNRDNISSNDWICLNLDSFNDQQSLYGFYVNPYGIQMDSRYANNVEDLGFDMVWYSAGKINNEGWVAEFSIPLKSIRYSDSNPVEMAVFFERRISRFSEQSSFPEFDPQKGFAILTQMTPMIYYDLEHYTLLEILPAVTYNQQYAIDKGELASTESKGEVSLTAKYGITSDLILDGTYNPDFSQIEADAGQVDVNLRSNLFYEEKRPFFLEGSEVFKLGATAMTEIDPVRTIVHTRNIVDPLTGIKLSGKLSKKITISSLYAMDELKGSLLNPEDDYAHFGIFRLKRAFEDDGYIGGVFAGRELKNSHNRIAGLDGMFRLNKSAVLEYNGLFSFTKYEDGSTKNGEYTLGLKYYFETRDFDYGITYKDISKDFNIESGFLTRTGVQTITGLIRPKIFTESEIFRRFTFEGFTAHTRDKFSDQWETFNHASLGILLPGNLQTSFKYIYSTEIFFGQKFNTGGYQISGGGWFNKLFYLNLLYKKSDAIYYPTSPTAINLPYQGNSNRFTATLNFLPTENLTTEFSFIYYDFYRESDNEKIYDYPLSRVKISYQLNKHLLFRGIAQYNGFREELLTDFLASFTYIPGTVFHLGYGSLYEKIKWVNDRYENSEDLLETKRGFFLKVSYLWRN